MTKEERIIHMINHCSGLVKRGRIISDGNGNSGGPENISIRPGMGIGRIIRLLCEQDGVSQKYIAEKLDLRPQSMSEVLGKMEASGLIERKPNEDDRRETFVYITDYGRERKAMFEKRAREQADEFLSCLSEEEKEVLTELLEKLEKTNGCNCDCEK